MPVNKDTVEIKPDVIKIVAAKGTARVIEYEMKDPEEPGNVPNWFPGVILLLRDEINDDEKIVVQDKIIKIIKKTTIDRFLDWVKGRRAASTNEMNPDEEAENAGEPVPDKKLHH